MSRFGDTLLALKGKLVGMFSSPAIGETPAKPWKPQPTTDTNYVLTRGYDPSYVVNDGEGGVDEKWLYPVARRHHS